MLKKIVLVFAAVALVAKAQIPSLGWCPDYVPMANFDIEKFMGVWYEAERYFQITEVVSRCVTTNYTRGHDGKIRVSNEVTNRFTGVKRVLEGEVKPAASKSEEGKFQVKYTTVPLTPETHYSVLETDYTSFAVLWSCTGIGPVHAQNAWVMTRKRNAGGDILQQAYGVLDKYKIWKVPFVKTDQAECAYEPPLPAAPAATAAPAAAPAPAPAPAAAPAPAPAPASAPVAEQPEEPIVKPAERKASEVPHLRSAPILPEVEATDETRNEEVAVLPEASASPNAEKPENLPVAEEKPAADENKPQEVEFKPVAPETIPEVILKVAESAKESAPAAPIAMESSVNPAAAESQTVEVAVPAESKPEKAAAEPAEEPKLVESPAEEPKPDIAPVAEIKSPEPMVEESKPLEIQAASEVAEESLPVEPLPVMKSETVEIARPLEEPAIELPSKPEVVVLESVATKSVENIAPVEAAEEVKVAEPIAAAEEAPVESLLLKALEAPSAAESKPVVSAEPSSPVVMVESVEAEVPAVKAPEVAAEEPKSEAKP